jgi:glycosyltransferase involved in cell wall biosynthesis
MRVALDARSLASPSLRGWDRYTVALARGLQARGVEVVLLHRARAPLVEGHLDHMPCEIVGLPDRGTLWWEQVAVPLALRTQRIDLYHAPTEYGVPFAAPCPVALTVHSATAHSYADLIRRGLLPGTLTDYVGPDADPYRLTFGSLYWHAQVACADWIFTPSEFCRREVVEFLPVRAERVSVTPLAVPHQFLRPPSAKEALAAALARLGVRRAYLLYVGGYERHKNIAGLLRAFALVRRERPDLSLVLVGGGAPPEAVRRAMQALGLAAGRDVVLLGGLTPELVDLYDAAELLVTLSWRESFCLPALEAMSHGVPVVASAWGATAEYVDGAGRLVDPRDPAAAAQAVLDLLEPAARRAASERGPAIAAEFSWDTTTDRTCEVYERLVAKRRAR